jgi:hypothetical protein
MKKIIGTCVLLAIFSHAHAVFAHGDHGVISATSAVYIASNTVRKMTFKDMGYQAGKLDASWKDIPNEDINVIAVGDGSYVVSVSNQKIQKQVFLKITGTGQVLDVLKDNNF